MKNQINIANSTKEIPEPRIISYLSEIQDNDFTIGDWNEMTDKEKLPYKVTELNC